MAAVVQAGHARDVLPPRARELTSTHDEPQVAREPPHCRSNPDSDTSKRAGSLYVGEQRVDLMGRLSNPPEPLAALTPHGIHISACSDSQPGAQREGHGSHTRPNVVSDPTELNPNCAELAPRAGPTSPGACH